MLMRRLTALAFAALLAGCAAQAPYEPPAETTYDGLVPVRDTDLEFAWLKPDLPLSGFDKVILAPVELQFRAVRPLTGTSAAQRSGRTEFPISEAGREKLAQIINEKFREALAKNRHYTLTDQPGAGVLTVKPALLDIVSHVPPEPTGRDDIFLDSVGEATLLVEIVDSASNETLARAADHRAAEPAGSIGSFGALRANQVTTWQEVRRLASRWAWMLEQRIEELYFVSKPK
jgi:hypothetical protein